MLENYTSSVADYFFLSINPNLLGNWLLCGTENALYEVSRYVKLEVYVKMLADLNKLNGFTKSSNDA